MRGAFERRALRITTVVLVIFGIWHALQRSTFVLDVAISIVGIFLFWRYGDGLNQDRTSTLAFCTLLVLHNIGLYDRVTLLLPWDKWMHLIGGAVIALFFSRMYAKERWSAAKMAFTIIILTLGIGAFHEIVEWLGFRVGGTGQGFLLYGAGDFGEWQDAITDMACNLGGALIATYFSTRKRKK